MIYSCSNRLAWQENTIHYHLLMYTKDKHMNLNKCISQVSLSFVNLGNQETFICLFIGLFIIFTGFLRQNTGA